MDKLNGSFISANGSVFRPVPMRLYRYPSPLGLGPEGIRGKAVNHFLLFYEAGPDYLERRPEFRGQHLKYAWDAHARGELVVAGALAKPVDGAVLMFSGEDKSVAEEFARGDPYVTNGLVARWYVREWNTVVGELAANPVRSDDL